MSMTQCQYLVTLRAFLVVRVKSFYPRKEKELSKAFDSIRDELHRQYRMAYLPPNNDGGEGWRNVQVKMTSKKNLTVRTRLGYFNRPEKEP